MNINVTRKRKPCEEMPRLRRCIVPNCHNDSRTCPALKFFYVPYNLERRALWLKILHREDCWMRSIASVCEMHFEPKYITNHNNTKRLTRNSVPSLKPIASNSVEPIASTSVEPIASTSVERIVGTSLDHRALTTPIENIENEQPEKRIKLEPKTETEPQYLAILCKASEQPDEPLVDMMSFGIARDPNAERRTKRRYRTEFKTFALGLYFKSPASYRILHNSYRLPRVSALYRFCIPASTVLDEVVLKALEMKVNNLRAEEKHCVICVGTIDVAPNIHYDANKDRITGFHEVDGVMTLEPARKVLVVSVQGLFHHWRQAIAFSYLANFQDYRDVKVFLDKILETMFRIGLQVRALMSDVQTDVVTGARLREFTPKQPYFFQNGKKIYYLHDPTYLLRDIRDALMTHDFLLYNTLVAKWQHIENCCKQDFKMDQRLIPKVTLEHISCHKHHKNDIKLAAELFSSRVVTVIFRYIEIRALCAKAKVTAKFITMINKLMEIINFSTVIPPEDNSSLFSGDSSQVDFLVEILPLFQNVRLVNAVTQKNNTENARVMEATRVTINSILQLYGQLKVEGSWSSPVGLTRDSLNSFFNKVRDKFNTLPTTKQVTTCIAKYPIFNIFQYFSKKSCSSDLGIFLSNVKEMPNIDRYEDERVESYVDLSANASSQFSAIKLPSENKLEHLALYLLYRGYLQHDDCDEMRLYTCSLDGGGPAGGYTTNDGDIINMVPKEFSEFVEILELKFRDYFKENRLTRSICGLLSFVKNVTFEMPCVCFPLDYVKHLYLRLRLYLVLEYNNKLFRENEDCRTVLVVTDL